MQQGKTETMGLEEFDFLFLFYYKLKHEIQGTISGRWFSLWAVSKFEFFRNVFDKVNTKKYQR